MLECALEKLEDHNSCVVPEQLTRWNSSCCISTKDVTFLAEKFQCVVTAASGDLNKLENNYKTLRVLLKLINTISLQCNELEALQKMPQLLENTIGMYVCTCVSDMYMAVHCYIM